MFCSVFNGMHVVFIPYSVMKVNPASWMHMITRFKGKLVLRNAILRPMSVDWSNLEKFGIVIS